ncbi:hypothetical protein [Tenacibaculum larymnensis]|uniref:Uncharacterized protein n=1 Tax=Tenacibaculum larymnensis TaxID=2878201 RepID=A0A9X4ENH5_9FLAO|nr:hypothetical protein [Tenacibaculum larymnensis]MDE1206358.1 hypothetical protein [Tenacibaculum larymnensis]
MNKIYQPIKQKKYWHRFMSLFFPPIIPILLLSLIPIKKNSIAFSTTLTIGYSIVWGILSFFIVRNYIKEIQINKTQVIIKGTNFNKEWERTYKLKDISIEIKSQGYGRGKVEYFLKLLTPSSSYKINKFKEWEYLDLLEIYQTLSQNKKDDTHLLNLLKSKIQPRKTRHFDQREKSHF